MDLFTKDVPSFDPQDVEQNKTISGVSYLFFLFFLPLVTQPNSRFGRYNANQALVLFLAGTIVNLVLGFVQRLMYFFLFEWMLGIAMSLFGMAYLAVMLICMIYTLQGRPVRIPVLGHITLIRY